MEDLRTVLVSWRKEIGLESSLCMGVRVSADSCNSLGSTAAVGSGACSMGEQRAKSISCRIKSRSFISLPVCWGEQHSGLCTGFWGWVLRPIQFPEKKAIRKLLKTSVKSFSGWPALCQSNENTWWEGAIVLHKPAAPELCVVEVVSVLFWAAEPALGTLWLLSEGLQVPYSRTAGAVLAVQHYWKGVWGRMLAVFVERDFFLSVACALGFLGQWYMATAAWKEHCRVSSRFEQAAAQEYLDLLLQILTFGLLMSSDIFQPPKKAAVTDGFALDQARIVLFSWHPCILQPFLLFK